MLARIFLEKETDHDVNILHTELCSTLFTDLTG